MATSPEGYDDLLERPIVGVLATLGPDGTPNAAPMWFASEDGLLTFTHTTARKKIMNRQANPNYSAARVRRPHHPGV